VRVYIRCDSSYDIGSGHVMRCLTLACTLRGLGAHVNFICLDLPGSLCGYIETKGFSVYRLKWSDSFGLRETVGVLVNNSEDAQIKDSKKSLEIIKRNGGADLVVVDQYSLCAEWEKRMRLEAPKIMVIDDLADRPHDCDLLLDQNYYKNMSSRYEGLVPDHCTRLLGPGYSLLRTEFYEAREILKIRGGVVRRVLIFFGGSDPGNETVKALKAVGLANRPDIAVDVVVGANNPNKDQVKEICNSIENTSFYCQVENMAELMSSADLSIGAGGVSMIERCFLGLPSIVVIIAQNQYQTAVDIAETGAVLLAGRNFDLGIERLFDIYQSIIDNSNGLKEMEKKALNLVGNNKSHHIAQVIMNNFKTR